MPRYIDAVSKAEVLETYAELYDVFDDYKEIIKELHKVYDKINALPTADVPDRKVGKWIKTEGRLSWHCSLCKVDDQFAYCWNREKGDYDFQDNYCPSCGARMEGK